MGFDISLYAVDESRFIEFAESSLWDVLWYYNDTYSPESNLELAEQSWLCFHDGPEGYNGTNKEWFNYLHYCTVPHKGIGIYRFLEPPATFGLFKHNELHSRAIVPDQFLRIKLREYLSRYSTEMLLQLFIAMKFCRNPFVVDIGDNEGFKLRGPDELVQSAKKVKSISNESYAKFADLMSRLTHEKNRNMGWPDSLLTLSDIVFPILPAYEDSGCLISSWTGAEAKFVLRCVKEILAEAPILEDPDWETVPLMRFPFVNKLLRLEHLDLTRTTVLGFLS